MRILFLVSSIGLGHARRSLKVAEKLEKHDISVTMLAAKPVSDFLRVHGLEVHKDSSRLLTLAEPVESMETETGKISIGPLKGLKFVNRLRHNASVMKKVYAQLRPDLVIGDEAWELFFWKPEGKVVFTTDFIRYPGKGLTAYLLNKILTRIYRSSSLLIVYGEEGEFGDLGFIGAHAHYAGLPGLSKDDVLNWEEVKKRLGIRGRLLLVTTGGTSVGSDLFAVALEAHRILRMELRDLTTLLVLGPRGNISLDSRAPRGIKLLGFVKDLPALMYSSDCVITHAGTGSLSELASLGTRAIAVPIEEHFEQLENIRRYSIFENIEFIRRGDLTPELLSSKVRKGIMSKSLPFRELDGAGKAGDIIIHYIHGLKTPEDR